ncbi:MAG TPA: Rpn family recombination-promoting nuclease/putative transposase [Polyangium sp.]|nr:Rpn family recombination-promoting nuclease/putative transposase [Polyangium sp.]
MVFADLKNDFVFRRVFAAHPHILRGLLNDLLDRTGDRAIESLEYLPSEQLPLIPGLKLSILEVRCKDRSGGIFIVEMQLVHMAGFLNRMVYNGSKAYVNQLKAGESYTKLVDVVAIAICDFVLWPDVEQDKLNEARMPMHSRFAMVEEQTGNRKLLQVQYAFLELPKVPKEKPKGGAALWAWLFVNARKLDKTPDDLPQGPMTEAMELAKEASFTEGELEAYHKVLDEIQQARDYGEEKMAQGRAEGHKTGVAEGKASALLMVLEMRGLTTTESLRERISNCKDVAWLDAWISRAMQARTIDEVFGLREDA